MPRDHGRIALATDLYELTMGATYLALGMDETATFSLFVRTLPRRRSYLVAAGLQEALSRLGALAFDGRSADWLRSTGQLQDEAIARLAETRFAGDVWAMAEGRVVFAGEPLLEVQAPMVQAQLVETLVLNAIHYPTLVASKAARCVAAARGKALVDFGMRRTPDLDASVAAARAAYMAGFVATSNVLAGREIGIPISGTVAHSLVEAFPSELEAFRGYAQTARGAVTLLVDTYDSMRGVEHAVEIARDLARVGRRVDAVRLDSGDLGRLARGARRLLDDSGLRSVRIFASGGLDEYEIARLERDAAPIDGYGVGTRLGMSSDEPVLDMAYKLVAYGGRPCLKLSEGKATLALPKQVWRRRTAGRFVEDRIGVRDEAAPRGDGWEALLAPVMIRGRPTPQPSLAELRARHRQEMDSLAPELKDVERTAEYPVTFSDALRDRQRVAVDLVRRREGL